ncbi:MAG TPA: PKD domain-containing protein [Flavitalea sp.]|nr:PKD domain-containing protein [Flavitalea sp.]
MNRILSLVFFIAPILASSQTTEKSIVAANRERIGFLEFRPSDYPEGKHPLIIFLHGIGEKGNGTGAQLRRVHCCGIPAYIRGGNKMRFTWQGKTESFVVLSPQLSTKYSRWQPFYTSELIKYAKANLNIDPDRIFVTGLSMGGGGTWNFASSSLTNAESVAGIAPVVAPCMMSNGCNIANADLPVMAIHVWDDKAAPASCTVNAIKSINACHPAVTPNLIMYANGGHYVWVRRAFDTAHTYQDPNMYEWFLAQNRKSAPNIKPVARAGVDQSVTTGDASAVLSAGASSDADGTIVRYVWSKLSGPNKGTLKGVGTSSLKVTDLTTSGTYKYQVKVIDNRAEWSYDTVVVNVVKGEQKPNILPLAFAGADTTIMNGATFSLNGSASSDPDGEIINYLWSKTSGPDKYTFADSGNAITAVSLLDAGIYTFRLTVTDNRNEVSTDDITVTVNKIETPHRTGAPSPPVVTGNVVVVYPNPAKSGITLALTSPELGNAVAVVYDNMGRLTSKISFYKSQTNFQQKLNIMNLERGLFFIDVIIGRKARLRAKFIKQ